MINKILRIKIKGTIELKSGLHIGSSSEYAGIGAVSNVVIRDPLTNKPIIPGSSLKGKMRTLLAKAISCNNSNNNAPPQTHEEDTEEVVRLFGGSIKKEKELKESRLQFFDCMLKEESFKKLKESDKGLYLTEIKFENTINRKTLKADPRQVERVPRGAIYIFELMYIFPENTREISEDLKNIRNAVDLLNEDYLGGSGSRGYGRVDLKIEDIEGLYFDEKTITKYSGEELNEYKDILTKVGEKN